MIISTRKLATLILVLMLLAVSVSAKTTNTGYNPAAHVVERPGGIASPLPHIAALIIAGVGVALLYFFGGAMGSQMAIMLAAPALISHGAPLIVSGITGAGGLQEPRLVAPGVAQPQAPMSHTSNKPPVTYHQYNKLPVTYHQYNKPPVTDTEVFDVDTNEANNELLGKTDAFEQAIYSMAGEETGGKTDLFEQKIYEIAGDDGTGNEQVGSNDESEANSGVYEDKIGAFEQAIYEVAGDTGAGNDGDR
jgi:hypothetical protein